MITWMELSDGRDDVACVRILLSGVWAYCDSCTCADRKESLETKQYMYCTLLCENDKCSRGKLKLVTTEDSESTLQKVKMDPTFVPLRKNVKDNFPLQHSEW